MKTTRITAVAVLIVANSLALHVALSQQLGIKRTDLQRHHLSGRRPPMTGPAQMSSFRATF